MAYNFKKLTVLVVDDDATMCLVVCNIFRTLKVKDCLSARNGEDALELFKEHKPDVVLTDWNMKDMCGLELTKAIRDIDKETNGVTPVILTSGYADMEKVKEAIDTGVNDFLLKPFSVNDLASRVAYVVENPRECIDIEGYFGPDRRYGDASEYNGPDRRKEGAS